jgi:hypothetical protein
MITVSTAAQRYGAAGWTKEPYISGVELKKATDRARITGIDLLNQSRLRLARL